MKRLWTSAVVGCGALVLAACGSSGGQGGGADSVTILVSAGVSQSGTLGRNAAMTVLSVKAAAAYVNAHGGVNGKHVKVSVLDDQGDPTTAVSKLQSALQSDTKPLAWFDAGPSNVAAAVLPILTQNKVLSFNVASTPNSDDGAKFPYNFDLATSPADDAAAFCPYAKGQGYSKVAVIYGDDAYGSTLGPAIASKCKAAGLTITDVAKYDPTSLDITPQLLQLKSGHPDALLMEGYGAPVGYVLKGARKIGFDVPILGDLATAATDTVTTSPPSGLLGQPEESKLRVEVFKSTRYAPAAQQWPGLNSMIKALKAQGKIPASLVLAYTYDGVELLAQGAKSAHTSSDPAAIAKAIVGLHGKGGLNTGVFEKYYFTASDHSPQEPPSAFTFATPTKLIDGQYGAPGST